MTTSTPTTAALDLSRVVLNLRMMGFEVAPPVPGAMHLTVKLADTLTSFCFDEQGRCLTETGLPQYQNAPDPTFQATYTVVKAAHELGVTDSLDHWILTNASMVEIPESVTETEDKIRLSDVSIRTTMLWMEDYDLNQRRVLTEMFFHGIPVWHTMLYHEYSDYELNWREFVHTVVEDFLTNGGVIPSTITRAFLEEMVTTTQEGHAS